MTRRNWSIDPDPGRWDGPSRSPSVWVFWLAVVVIVILTEWLFS